MKIVTLIENTACRENLSCEHGLSLYMETKSHKILFDAGQTGAFADNAQRLGVDLAAVDMAILSHGHYDHSGGFGRFLEMNKTAKIYVNQQALKPHFNGAGGYIGIAPALTESDRLVFTQDVHKIAEGLTLYSCNDRERPYHMDNFGLQMEEKGVLAPDDFCHEQYLLVEEGEKRICISGCSHKGILNIAGWFRPDVLVGGFHFMKVDTQGEGAAFLKNAARELLRYPTVYYTGHCTGQEQFAYMKTYMDDRLQALSAGTVIHL